MRCEVLLFAQLADLLGARRMEIDLAEGATARDAADHVLGASPAAAALRDRIAIAVDERYVAPETILRAGSTIALIPPVSGG